jgi:ribosome biogenesis GTPase A
MPTNGEGNYSQRRKMLHATATHKQIEQVKNEAKKILNKVLERHGGKIPKIGVVGKRLKKEGKKERKKKKRKERTNVSLLIGMPNTGKSSLVNSLIGKHVVSVSRTCGHTKHWQTHLLRDEEDEEKIVATLIDSPGIIFPIVVQASNMNADESPLAW